MSAPSISTMQAVENFMRAHEGAMFRHAFDFDNMENLNRDQRRMNPHQPGLLPAGAHSKQAGHIRALQQMLGEALHEGGLRVSTPDERFVLQEVFNHAIGALNYLHGQQNADLLEAQKLGDSGWAERMLRRDGDIPAHVPLTPAQTMLIERQVRVSARDAMVVGNEVSELEAMRDELQMIRGLATKGQRRIGGSGAGADLP